MSLNIALAVDCILSEGPGSRFALWLQGCTHRCPGCGNRAWWDRGGGVAVDPVEVAESILSAQRVWGLEGVTVSGGEPFLQQDALLEVLRSCQLSGLSTIVFTGFIRDQLDGLDYVDVLVDGPFLQDRPEEDRNLVGSTNQRFHYLTDRYNSEIEISDPRVTSRDFDMLGRCVWKQYPSLERKAWA